MGACGLELIPSRPGAIGTGHALTPSPPGAEGTGHALSFSGNNWRRSVLHTKVGLAMKLFITFFLVVFTVLPALAGDEEKQFDLALEEALQRPADPRTQARLARWNSDPMARVAMHMASEQARIMGGNQPGMGRPRALVFSVELRKGLASALTVASSASGVEFYERRMAVITWPWEKEDEAKPALPLDEQLTVMLGDRLENP